MRYIRKRIKIGLLAVISTLVLGGFVYPSASALVYRPPNWSFETGVLCTVPTDWVMKTWDYTGSPPPISTYIHEVCQNNTHYFSGVRSCCLHSKVVDTDGTKRDRYSWTWIEPKDWICLPGATHVRFYIRDIQSTHSLSWGWNNEIWVGFNDSVTVRRTRIFNHGETVNYHYYNDTKIGADGFTWYEYVYPIPPDIDECHMKVQIICIAGDWTFYNPSYFADMRFCVDDVELLWESPVYGPRISELYGRFIEGPTDQMGNLTTGAVDVWFDIKDPLDARTLQNAGFTTPIAPEAFQFDYIAFNVRDQVGNTTHIPCEGGTYSEVWRNPADPNYFTYQGAPYKGYVPLDDVNFRHACAHCIPKDEIVAVVYGGIMAATIDSTVPEAQRAWHKPGVDGHPLALGDPFATTEYDPETGVYHDACSILRYGGYVWEPTAPNPAPKYTASDPDGNWLDPHLHAAADNPSTSWDDTSWMPMNHITFAGVTKAFSPTSWGKDDLCTRNWRAIGLPIEHVVVPYSYLTDTMMNYYEFDMYAAGWKVGRFPDHLYGFFHSSNNFCPRGYNIPGIGDSELDAILEIIEQSTDVNEVKQACWDAQDMIAEKLPYIVTVTRPLISAFAAAGAPGHSDTLEGIVNSPGFGSENDWTFYDLHWASDVDPDTNPYGLCGTVNMIVGSEPTNYHPAYASTADEWKILGRIFDGLINIDPYTLHDIPWIATNWEIEKWASDDEVDTLLAGEGIIGSLWQEDWPVYRENWNMTSWEDDDGGGTLTIGDQVDFENDPAEYQVTDITWDIVVETKVFPHDKKMKLSGTDPVLPKPPTEILAGQMNTTQWHEELPVRSTMWHVENFTDNDDGVLSRSDEIFLSEKIEVIGESVGHGDNETTTFWLDNTPVIENSETVYCNGTETNATYYPNTIDYATGNITFTTAPPNCTDITADYTYYAPPSWYHVDSVTVTLHLDKKIFVVGEYVGHGDNETTTFWLDNTPVIENSETVYCNGTETNSTYYPNTIDYATGNITFTTAPPNCTDITADYAYTDGIDKVMELAGTGMKIVFWLRDDVYWHDGVQFTASDIEFALEWLKEQKVGRARPMWISLVDVAVVGPQKAVVYLNSSSLWLFYHVAGPHIWLANDAACWATMFPKHIYDNTGPAFHPELETNPINPELTCLIGTGPFVYRADSNLVSGGYAHLTGYRPQSSPVSTHWFMSVPDEDALLTEMFHWIGDGTSDGIIDVRDLAKAGKAYARTPPDPLYDKEADTDPEPTYHTNDDRVDMRDIAEISKGWGKKRKYP